MFQSKVGTEQQRVRLRAYFESVADGAFCSWGDIERATGVYMAAQRERALARKVATQVRGTSYSAVSGSGLCMSDENNAPLIADKQRTRVGRAVGRAKKRTKQLLTKHREKMAQPVAQRMELQACGYAAVQTAMREVPKPPARIPRASTAPVFPVGLNGARYLANVKT